MHGAVIDQHAIAALEGKAGHAIGGGFLLFRPAVRTGPDASGTGDGININQRDRDIHGIKRQRRTDPRESKKSCCGRDGYAGRPHRGTTRRR